MSATPLAEPRASSCWSRWRSRRARHRATGTSAVEFVDADADRRAQRRAPRQGGPDRRAVVPDRRGRRAGRPARAGRRGDLPRAHGRPRGGGRPRRAAPVGHGPRDRRRARCSRCRPRSWRGCDDRARASSRSPGGRTSASRRSSTRSSAARSRSSPTSRRPPAARSAASPRGPATWQAVLCDLPGVQRPRDVLTDAHAAPRRARAGRVRRRAVRPRRRRAIGGPGDRFIAEALAGAKPPVTIAVNKFDRLKRPQRRRGAAGRRRAGRVRPRRRDLPRSPARKGHGRRRAGRRTSSRSCPRARSTSARTRSPT